MSELCFALCSGGGTSTALPEAYLLVPRSDTVQLLYLFIYAGTADRHHRLPVDSITTSLMRLVHDVLVEPHCTAAHMAFPSPSQFAQSARCIACRGLP